MSQKEYLIYWPQSVIDGWWRDCNDDYPPVGSIYMYKDGKYIILYKKNEDNRYIRYDLSTKKFYRVNIYKTVETKVKEVRVENLRPYFSRHKIYTQDILFAKIFLYLKNSYKLSRFKNPVRYIEAFDTLDAQAIEEWYNAGIVIEEVEKIFKQACNDSPTHHHFYEMRYRPQDFDKKMLKIIKKIHSVKIKSLEGFSFFDENKLNIYEKLLSRSKLPEYDDIFTFTTYRGEHSIFDFGHYHAEDARNILIAVIEEFNLDIDAVCRFINRLKRVEACDISDLVDGYHYRDYLRMERELNHENLAKVDKYPKNWLTSFRRTKRNYEDAKKKIDEEKFHNQVLHNAHLEYNDKNFSIRLPTSSSEVRREGAGLKHCVASYVGKITEGKTCIMFLRERYDEDEPFVTVEVKNNAVTQAYGYQDSKPSKEALRFLAKWAKKKNLTLAWRWEKDFRIRGR